jgi:HK97 family phage major capsid protein
MNFSDRIEDAQKKLDGTRGDIAELIGMAEAEERDLSDDESLQLEAYAKDVESLEKRITDLERAEKAMAQRVVEKQAPQILKQRGHVERKPGELIVKQAVTAYMAHIDRKDKLAVAKEMFPRDAGLQEVIKTAINPADTTTEGWATELTEEANQGFLDLLRGESMAAQCWPSAGVSLMFDGYTALNVPSRAGGTTDAASGWTPEGGAIPVRKLTFATQRIEPYKWAAIVTMTREIMTRSTPAIMGIVQSALVSDTATKLDQDYFGEAAAVAGFNPRGIFEGVTGTPAATGGTTPGDDMLQDLRNLLDPIYAANMGQSLFIFMHNSTALSMSTVLYNGTYLFRDELSRGTLLGVPVIVSTNAPTDEIWAVDMAQQAVARGGMRFDVSDTATIVEYDDDTGTDPHMDAGAPRSPNTGTVSDAINAVDAAGGLGNVRSLFQTETVAIRTIQDLSWATLRDGSVNRITGVAY